MAARKRRRTGKRKGRGKGRNTKIILGCIAAVVLVYAGISVFFAVHTEKTIEQKMKDYVLTITAEDGAKEEIAGTDISLVNKGGSKAGAFLWPAYVLGGKTVDMTASLSYDKDKLEDKIDALTVVTAEQIPPESAYPEFDGEEFTIHAETAGTTINIDVLKKKIAEAVENLDLNLDLKESDCYEAPRYTSESEEVKTACEEMNRYCTASVTYTMDESVTIDKTVIAKWLSVDEDMNVKIRKKRIKKWLEDFGNKYDTVGTERTFTTPSGKAATVSGGTYGWSIDEDTEYEVILKAVKNGEEITREPEYYIGGTAAAHEMPDWGDTYVEVDLTEQHMWYVKGGQVALETDVVTGAPTKEKETPTGVYTILEKSEHEILKGEIQESTGKPEYETEVAYWMRVTWEGVGFHDATWQSAFGGDRYKTVGSHGCINMPLDKAAQLYEMIEEGVPVIIHY